MTLNNTGVVAPRSRTRMAAVGVEGWRGGGRGGEGAERATTPDSFYS